MMNSALQLKYYHFDKSSYNANQINELLVLLTFTLPHSVDCKLEQLAPVLLILPYQLEFKASWHVLSLPCTFANCSGDISALGWENITVRVKETGAGVAKMERNLAESPTKQQIQLFADVGWFMPSRDYCFQCRYLSVCSAVGVGDTRTKHHPGSRSLRDHAAAELSSCPRSPPRLLCLGLI